MPLTTMIFDLGGVLVQTHWDRVTKPLAKMSGLTPERVEEIIAGEAGYKFMLGQSDPIEFHRQVTTQLALEMEPDSLFAIWSSIIAPNEGIEELVERLHGRYRLVVGSNTDALHYTRSVEVQPALRHFDDALLSFELGHCKPDSAFFELGLERLSATPEECVFIDDRQDNVQAARTLGITAIQFASTKQLESDLAELGLL